MMYVTIRFYPSLLTETHLFYGSSFCDRRNPNTSIYQTELRNAKNNLQLLENLELGCRNYKNQIALLCQILKYLWVFDNGPNYIISGITGDNFKRVEVKIIFHTLLENIH